MSKFKIGDEIAQYSTSRITMKKIIFKTRLNYTLETLNRGDRGVHNIEYVDKEYELLSDVRKRLPEEFI